MKKIALFLGLLTMVIVNVNAQNKTNYRFGLFAGANIANMQLDNAFAFHGILWTPMTDVKQKAHVGLRLGGLFDLGFNRTFHFQTELFYNQVGFNQEGTYTDISGSWDCKSKTSIHELSIALLIKIKPIKWISVDLGAQPNVTLSVTNKAKLTYEKMLKNEVYAYFPEGYKVFNIDVVGGLTVYPIDKLFVTLRYNFGINNILKKDSPYYQIYSDGHSELKHLYSDATSKNRTFQISIGFLF